MEELGVTNITGFKTVYAVFNDPGYGELQEVYYEQSREPGKQAPAVFNVGAT